MHLGTEIRFSADTATTATPTGLCAGTGVLTRDGELPVEHLAAGDRIITRDAGMVTLREVRVVEADCATIRIKAGSLGHTRPDTDMVVAPGAMVHIRDWRATALFGKPSATVPAARLVDGEFVAEQAPGKVRLFSLVFDAAHIVYANGLEIATA